MKRNFTRLALLALMCFGATLKAQKIGYTNVELLLTYMKETKVVEQELATLEKKLGEQLQVKQKYYQQKLQEYMAKAQAKTISEAESQAAVGELKRLEGEIQSDLQGAEATLMKKRMVLLKPIQDKMQNAIDAAAKEGGYDYVLNQSVGSGIPSILFGQDTHNLTEMIAKKLGINVEE